MKLADHEEVKRLAFDHAGRTVVVTYRGNSAAIERTMRELNLGASLAGRKIVGDDDIELGANDAQQRRLLIIVLLINAALFALELVTGFLANSMGLVADSLDMLADALVKAFRPRSAGGNGRRALRGGPDPRCPRGGERARR